jgi:hypothetical protein
MVLQNAEPEDKTEIHRQLGLTIMYRHKDRTALAEVTPPLSVYARFVSEGGLELPSGIDHRGTACDTERYPEQARSASALLVHASRCIEMRPGRYHAEYHPA